MNKTQDKQKSRKFQTAFWRNYVTNHLVKFHEDFINPRSIGALRVRTGRQFILTNSLLKILLLPLTCVIHVNNIHLLQKYIAVYIKFIYLKKQVFLHVSVH